MWITGLKYSVFVALEPVEPVLIMKLYFSFHTLIQSKRNKGGKDLFILSIQKNNGHYSSH